MAGAGYKLFGSGDILTAGQVNTYLNEQTVMVFATTTARDTALSGVLAEGMTCYVKDMTGNGTAGACLYTGSAWVWTWSEWESFTPDWGLTVLTPASETWEFKMVPGGAYINGTTNLTSLGSTILLDLSGAGISFIGNVKSSYSTSIYMFDDSGADRYFGTGQVYGNTNLRFLYNTDSAVSGLVTNAAPFSWASGDQFMVSGFLPL